MPHQYYATLYPVTTTPRPCDKTYAGTPRVYRPAVRTVLSRAEETFYIEAAVLSATPPTSVKITITVGSAGGGRNAGSAIDQVVREEHQLSPVQDPRTKAFHSQVYSVQIPLPATDFEYTITATLSSTDGDAGAELSELSTPTTGTQTVVIV